MNLQLRSGETFTNVETGQVFTELIGGLKDFNFNIKKGSLTNLVDVELDAVLKLRFYPSAELMDMGKKEIFSKQFYITTEKILSSGIMKITENGIQITEKDIYAYLLLENEEYSVFDIV